MNEQYVTEQLKEHENRLNNHAERIRSVETQQAVSDTRVDNLCDRLDKLTNTLDKFTNTFSSMSTKIALGVLGTLGAGAIGLLFIAVQKVIFK